MPIPSSMIQLLPIWKIFSGSKHPRQTIFPCHFSISSSELIHLHWLPVKSGLNLKLQSSLTYCSAHNNLFISVIYFHLEQKLARYDHLSKACYTDRSQN
jgi:hypothetical protein